MINLPRNVRSCIAKLCSSTLPIRIETGRFERIDEANRLCNYCDSNNIENENHFIFQCKAYHDIRHNLFEHVKSLYPDFENRCIVDKWNILMADKRIIPQTGKFIKLAFQKRNNMTFIK